MWWTTLVVLSTYDCCTHIYGGTFGLCLNSDLSIWTTMLGPPNLIGESWVTNLQLQISWKYCMAVTLASCAASVTGYSLLHQCIKTSHFWRDNYEFFQNKEASISQTSCLSASGHHHLWLNDVCKRGSKSCNDNLSPLHTLRCSSTIMILGTW